MAALAVFTSTINANLLFPTERKVGQNRLVFVRTRNFVNVRLDPIINSEVPKTSEHVTVMVHARLDLSPTMIPTSTNTRRHVTSFRI
jgi:hypothetical protein